MNEDDRGYWRRRPTPTYNAPELFAATTPLEPRKYELRRDAQDENHYIMDVDVTERKLERMEADTSMLSYRMRARSHARSRCTASSGRPFAEEGLRECQGAWVHKGHGVVMPFPPP